MRPARRATDTPTFSAAAPRRYFQLCTTPGAAGDNSCYGAALPSGGISPCQQCVLLCEGGPTCTPCTAAASCPPGDAPLQRGLLRYTLTAATTLCTQRLLCRPAVTVQWLVADAASGAVSTPAPLSAGVNQPPVAGALVVALTTAGGAGAGQPQPLVVDSVAAAAEILVLHKVSPPPL